jgi:solute carrier family 8 (sodium/calcium exchanger)
MHLLSLPWKILFALVPPTQWCGGKLAFCVALVMIGALTACIGEFATLFGCNLGLKDEVTAITFVALGTSLPDTFASAQAARQAPDADGAIGNVTGSNAVNVFFGLGLPWIIACAYYGSTSGFYCYPAGALAFSVVVFIICALLCFAALYAKRKCDGGELGGTTFISRTGVSIFCVMLWFIYVLLSSMLVYGAFENPFASANAKTADDCVVS